MLLEYYKKELIRGINYPHILDKYLSTPSINRLKNVGYFCGMDYASKDIYDFKEYITRYDHSLTTALLTYRLTNDITSMISGLYHDISTPCFSHVIDYMNKDFEHQESTEEYTSSIIRNDKILLSHLHEDGIKVEDIINYKSNTVVDNERPKLCADRIDGIVLTGISWTKDINRSDISNIVSNLALYKNEDNENEIGFKNIDVARRVMEINGNIDYLCHSSHDNYMMTLLSNITKYAIDKKYISYKELYEMDEERLFGLLLNIDDEKLENLLYEFVNIKSNEIEIINIPNIKRRKINPLVNGKRLK